MGMVRMKVMVLVMVVRSVLRSLLSRGHAPLWCRGFHSHGHGGGQGEGTLGSLSGMCVWETVCLWDADAHISMS
jgi:hypothetical protein